MPLYLVELEDGSKYQVEADTQPTPEEVQGFFTEKEENKPFFDLSETLAATGKAFTSLGTTLPASMSQAWAGLGSPWQRGETSLRRQEEMKALQEELAAQEQEAIISGDSSVVSSAIREATPSLGFSASTLVPSLIAGAGTGLATRNPRAAMAAAAGTSSLMAYRMAGSQFLDDARDRINAYFQENFQRLPNEQEQEEAYQELLPLARKFGAAEAAPEALGNLVLGGAGKYIRRVLGGKNGITELASNALNKVITGGKALAAGVGAVGSELATEGVTAAEQARIQKQFEEGTLRGVAPEDVQLPDRSLAAIGEGIKDVAPATLATMGLMGLAGLGPSAVSRGYRSLRPTAPEQPEPVLPPVANGVAFESLENAGASADVAPATTARLDEGAINENTPEVALETGASGVVKPEMALAAGDRITLPTRSIYQGRKATVDSVDKAGFVSVTTDDGQKMIIGADEVTLDAPVAQSSVAAQPTEARNTELFPDSTDFAGKLDNPAVLSKYEDKDGFGVAEYINPSTGTTDVYLAAFGDNDFIAYLRVYDESGTPTNRFTSKLERRSKSPGITKKMLSELQTRLPLEHEYTEDISVSTDGLRFISGQLRQGYDVALDGDGKPLTQEVAVSGESIVNDLPIQVDPNGKFENIRITNRKDFDKVRQVLGRMLESFGVGLGEKNVRWENGTAYIDLPILRKRLGFGPSAVSAGIRRATKPTDPGIVAAKEMVAPTAAVPGAEQTAILANEQIQQTQDLVDAVIYSMPPPPSEPAVQPVEAVEEAGPEVTPEMPVLEEIPVEETPSLPETGPPVVDQEAPAVTTVQAAPIQPPQENAPLAIPDTESLRQEPQDRVESREAEGAGARDQLLGAAAGEEEVTSFQEKLDSFWQEKPTPQTVWELAESVPEGVWVEDGSGALRSKKSKTRTTRRGTQVIEFETEWFNEETQQWEPLPQGYTQVEKRADGSFASNNSLPTAWTPGSYTEVSSGKRVITKPVVASQSTQSKTQEPITPQGTPTPATEGMLTPGGSAMERDVTKPEQMTPEEYLTPRIAKLEAEIAELEANQPNVNSKAYLYWQPRLTEAKRNLKALKEDRDEPGTDKPWAPGLQQRFIFEALDANEPVSAAAVDTYGIKLPEGYVKQRDLYVFQPEATGEPVQVAPSAAQVVKATAPGPVFQRVASEMDTMSLKDLSKYAEQQGMSRKEAVGFARDYIAKWSNQIVDKANGLFGRSIKLGFFPSKISKDGMRIVASGRGLSHKHGIEVDDSQSPLHAAWVAAHEFAHQIFPTAFLPKEASLAKGAHPKGLDDIKSKSKSEKLASDFANWLVSKEYPEHSDSIPSIPSGMRDYFESLIQPQTTTVATQNETAAPLAKEAAVAGASSSLTGGRSSELQPRETQETQPSTKEKARQILEQKTEKLKETAKNKVRAAADEYFDAPVKDDGYPDFEPLTKLPLQSQREMIVRSWEEANPELVRDARKKAADEARKVRADEKDDAAHQSATTFKKDYEEEEMKASKSKDERRRALDSITAKDKPLDERPEVTGQDVAFAKQLVQKEVPAATFATVMTAEEFLASESLTTAFRDIADGLRAGRIEGVFISSGHVFLFPENIIARQSDIKAAEELGIPVSVAAARRVILHESLGHLGFAGLDDVKRARIIDWVKRYSDELDFDRVLKKYPRESSEVQTEHALRVVEERLMEIIEKTGRWPQGGMWTELKDILQRIWNYITGTVNKIPTDKELLSVLRMLQSGSERMLEKSFAKTGLGGNVRLTNKPSYAGEKAEMPQFMRDSLDTAKVMAAAGKDSEEIRAVTGWFPGKYDGKMRWELPDDAVSLDTREWLNIDSNFPTKLGDLLNHNDLFEAYPEASEIEVLRYDDFGKGGGEFDGINTITIGKKGGYSESEFLSTLLHEVQHWIQSKEGFAKGGDSRMAFADPRMGLGSKEGIRAATKILKRILGNMRKPLSIKEFAKSAWQSDVVTSEIEESYKDYLKTTKKAALDYNLEKLAQETAAKEWYKNLAGEIEARDVQARQNLTPEQRRATAPYSSENIAKEDAIVMFGGGTQASYSTADEARLAELYQNLTPELPNPAVREAYDRLATNQTQVAISDLRNESGLSKDDFAQSLQTLFDNGQAVLSPASSIEQQEADAAEYGVFGHGGTPASFVTVMPETNPQYESRTPIILKAGASTSVGGVGMASISPSDNSERAQAIREGISKTNWNELSTAQRAQALEEFGLKSIQSRYFFDAAILPVRATNERTGEDRPASVYVAEPSPAIAIQFDASGLSNLLSGDAVTAFTAVYDAVQDLNPSPRLPRFSLNSTQEESENESAQKAEEKIKSIGKTISDIQAKANKAPWQGREIPEDVALANHPQVNKDVQGKLQAVARDIVEAQIRAGIPYEEMANEVTKPSFIGRVTKGNQFLAEPMRQFLLMEVGLAIQLEAKNLAKDGKRLDADILLSLYRDVIQAKENKASFASAMLNTQKFIINDENYSSIYIGNNIETLQAEERRKTVGTNAPGLPDEVKAVDAAKEQADKAVKDAVEDIQERSDEDFAMEAMDAEERGLWISAKKLISSIGEKVRELLNRGDKGYKASSAAAPSKFAGVSNETLKEAIKKDRAELKAVLKKLLGVEGTAPTKGTRKPKKTPAQVLAIRAALFNSMAKEGLPVDLETAVAGIAPVRRTMWDTMVERIAKGVTGKVESIEKTPDESKLLNDLTNQLTRVLRDSVQGEKKEAPKESLGLRALRAFGYVTSNDQLVREAWEAARENAVEVLADVKRAELGLPKLNEQLSTLESDLAEFTARKEGGNIAQQKAADSKIEATQEQIKDVKARIAAIEKQIKALRPDFVKRRDELMSEVPRQFFATSQARSIIREALDDKYETTKELLDNVEEARQHVIDRLNEAVDKEGNVDPARWDRDSSFIKRAFDDMVADMRESLAKAEAKRITAAREKLFSATEEEQIRIIQRKLNDLRPEEGGIKIPWDKLAQIRISEQKTLESQMFETLKSDPAFAGLPDSDLAKLSKIISKVWQKKREAVIAKELERIEARNDWSKKAKEAVKEHHPKIMRLINAGLFDDNALYALIAEEYGFRELTPEQQARAIAITEKFMDPKTPRYVRAALQKEFKDIMMEVRGPTLLQTLNAVWYSSVLSSMRTMTTIALSALNNGLTFIGEAVATVIANPTNPSKWVPILDSIDAIAKNLGPAAVDMWKYLKTGDSVYLDSNILNDPFYADQIKKGVALDGVDVGERMYRTSKNPVTKAIGWHVMVITRLLRVLDGFNTRLGKVSSMPFMYRRLTDEYDSSVVRALTDPAHYREKLIQDGVDPNSPALSALAMHAMHEDWDSQKGLLSNLEQNTNYNAAWSAMTGDPKGAGGVLYGSVKMVERFMGTVADTFEKAIDQRLEMMGKQGVEKDPLEDFIVRRLGKPSSYFLNYLASNLLPGFGLGFVRVVGNSLNQAISLIPGVGILRVMEGQDPRQKVAHRALLMRNQAFGMIGLMVMIKALKDIEDEPDDEKRGWFIEGNWEGLTPQQKAALFASGAQPNSIGYYKNGKRINIRYSEWPLASIFSLTGNLSDNSKYRPESWQTASAGSKAAKAVYYMWSSAFTMPAISQAMENLGAPRGSEDPFEAAERRIPKALASFAGGYIPRSIKDLDMWMQSETNRYKGWESLAKEIPFVRRAVGTEYLDVFGKRLETDRAPWSRVFTEGPDDPAYQLLGRLSAKGVWLSPPNPNGKLVGEGSKRREMTPDEGVMYQKEVGKGYRQLVLRYGNRLLQMPEERAKKFASQKAEEVREKATAKIDRIVR